MTEADIEMTEHRSKNTLGRSVPIKTKTDVEEDGTSEDGSPRPVCICAITSIFSCILLKFGLPVDNGQFSDTFKIAAKMIKMADLSHKVIAIYHILRPSGRDNFESFFMYPPHSNLLCMLLITSSLTNSIMTGKIN